MEYIKIDKSSSLTLHHQIYISIKDAILNKTLLPGDKLPTEEELCEYFNISRPVVRQAYNKLIEDELINRYKGKGSFVLNPKLKYTILQNLSSLTEQISMNDMNPTIVEFTLEVIDCPKDYYKNFGKYEPFKVIHIKRLYLGNNQPQFLVDAFLSYDFYKDVINELKQDETIIDFSKKMKDYINPTLNRHLVAIKFTPEICEYFKIDTASVGFRIDSTNQLIDGTITDFSITYIKGLGTRMTLNYF